MAEDFAGECCECECAGELSDGMGLGLAFHEGVDYFEGIGDLFPIDQMATVL